MAYWRQRRIDVLTGLIFAVATLPGAEKATTWEPAPATVYAWEKETAR